MAKLRTITFFALAGIMAFSLAGCNDEPEIKSNKPGNKQENEPDGRAGNPIITEWYTADPSAHVWPLDPDWLYLYPSTDMFPAAGCNLMDQYHVYATNNMIDWIDLGEIIRRDDLLNGTPTWQPDTNLAGWTSGTSLEGWGPHHEKAMFMWAPDAAYNPSLDKPYVFIFPHAIGGDGTTPNWGDTWKFGIAFSNSPYKDFKKDVYILKDINGDEIMGTGALIDPCIFEDEGVYYLATGGSQQFRIAKLSDDMLSLAEDWHIFNQSDGLNNYHEGPWMFTRKNDSGKKYYYLMYPGGNGGQGDDMLYSTSTEGPYGPWTYRGSILEPTGTGDTSHGSIVEFKGKWYLFYHNAELSGGAGNLRSVCADELFFNANGTIKKVVQTKTSAAQNGPELNTSGLDAKFGAGKYRIVKKYRDLESEKNINENDFTLNQTYYCKDKTVIVGGGAEKRTNDIPAGAVHNLHLAGSYVDWTEINGGSGGRAMLKISYAGANNASMAISVNGQSSINALTLPATGGWVASALQDSGPYLLELKPGTDNTIRMSGAGVNVSTMSIYFAK